MSPETNLIVLCVRTFLSDSGIPALRSALAEPLDWSVLEQNADNYAVMPLVAYVLSQSAGELIPQDKLKMLQDRLLRAARNNLAWVQEWLKLLKALEEAGIPVISFKGPALGLMTYRNLALREFIDLDLLVQPCDVLRAGDVLVRGGYALDSVVLDDTDAALIHSNREISFSNEERGTTVELHWGVLHEMFPFQLEVDQLFKAACVERQGGISFLSLSREHLLLYLCAHGTKHCWSILRWLCDVACYVQSNPNLDWDLCIRLAEPAGCELVLKHSLLLAEQVLSLKLPDLAKQYALDDVNARVLCNTALGFLFAEPKSEPGSFKSLRYHLAFATRWRDRVWLLFVRLFAPGQQDWEYVRLPRRLRSLYYLVRPIRVVVERFSVAARPSR